MLFYFLLLFFLLFYLSPFAFLSFWALGYLYTFMYTRLFHMSEIHRIQPTSFPTSFTPQNLTISFPFVLRTPAQSPPQHLHSCLELDRNLCATSPTCERCLLFVLGTASAVPAHHRSGINKKPVEGERPGKKFRWAGAEAGGIAGKKISVKAQDEVQEINNIKLPGAVEANKGLMGGWVSFEYFLRRASSCSYGREQRRPIMLGCSRRQLRRLGVCPPWR